MLLVTLGMESKIKDTLNKEEFQKIISHLKEVLNILDKVKEEDIKKIENIIQTEIIEKILSKKEKELNEREDFERYTEVNFFIDDLLEITNEIKEVFYNLSVWHNFRKVIRILERMYRTKYE